MRFWEVIKSPDRRPETLIIVEKAEDADEHRIGGQLVEQRKSLSRRLTHYRFGFVGGMEGERVVENTIEPIDVTKIRCVTVVVNNHAGRLSLLQATQHVCAAAR